jgi:hypothetical protein
MLAKARCSTPQARLAFAAVLAGSLLAVPAAGAQPPNNDFANAQELSGLPASATGSNVEATREPGEPSHGGIATGASVWFRWTAPSSANVTIDVCDATFDSALAVYTGSAVNSLTSVARNDDACGSGGDRSRVRFNAVAGTTYSIAVDGFDEGSFTIVIQLTPPPPPPPRPLPGLYQGRTEFPDSKRVRLSLSRSGRLILAFQISFKLDCYMRGFPSGDFSTEKFTVRGIRVSRNGRFSGTFRLRVRFTRGLRAVVSVKIRGRLRPPRRITGTVHETARVSDGARCRNLFNPVGWTVRHR